RSADSGRRWNDRGNRALCSHSNQVLAATHTTVLDLDDGTGRLPQHNDGEYVEVYQPEITRYRKPQYAPGSWRDCSGRSHLPVFALGAPDFGDGLCRSWPRFAAGGALQASSHLTSSNNVFGQLALDGPANANNACGVVINTR